MKSLFFKKSNLLPCITFTLLFLLFLSSLGNARVGHVTSPPITQNTDPDGDGDGLNDSLEDSLGTNKTNRLGDKDNDGLYDFEEYLDHYGTPDNDSDTPKYNYNDSTSYGDVLDIYHSFNLSSNKTGYLRDQNFATANGGFTDYLLWNVTFKGSQLPGGSAGSGTTYNNNIMIDVTFFSSYAGGSAGTGQPVVYSNNIMTNIRFSGQYAGSAFNSRLSYSNNTMTDVRFTGQHAGGGSSYQVVYSNNTMTDVRFTGQHAGGSLFSGAVSYLDNTVSNIIFSGASAGRSGTGSSSYRDNVIVSDSHDSDRDGLGDGNERLIIGTNPKNSDSDGDNLGDGWEVKYKDTPGVNPRLRANDTELSYDTDGDGLDLKGEGKAKADPTLKDTDGDGLNDSYEVLTLMSSPTLKDTDGDGLNDSYEVLTLMTNATLKDTDGDGLNDGWEVRYNGTSNVNPLITANASELASDLDSDGLNLTVEAKANTNPTLNDTDNDGLNDSYEWLTLMTDPTLNDTDGDGLTDGNEVLTLMTNATLNDTDGDGLNDGWEVRYNGTSGVNPLVTANVSELALDMDRDGLNLTKEAKANSDPTSEDTDGDGLTDGNEVLTLMTDPTLEDTDGDNLADGWEVRYNDASGVSPVVAATADELASDLDDDGLNLTEEERANTNPSLNDTDGDGLADGWEVRYNGTPGVNPLVAATADELASDTDNDGLNLAEEFKANTDPTTADNPMTTMMNTTKPNVSSSETNGILSFTLLVVVSIFISLGVALVVYRMRKRML